MLHHFCGLCQSRTFLSSPAVARTATCCEPANQKLLCTAQRSRKKASCLRHGMHQRNKGRWTQMCVRPNLDYVLLLRYSHSTWTWHRQMAAQCHLLDALPGIFKATNHVSEQSRTCTIAMAMQNVNRTQCSDHSS